MVNKEVLKKAAEIFQIICGIADYDYDEFGKYYYLANLDPFHSVDDEIVRAVKRANFFPEIRIFPDPTNEDRDSVLFRISFSEGFLESPFFTLVFRISGGGGVSFVEEVDFVG